ncbi:MAG: endonuclease/exonuclease/phosphatase family protein [Planctomycetes bacterium]|nr:endonuclease/exonuclease/phosphatase family protein [Planctomycetota bacterium]
MRLPRAALVIAALFAVAPPLAATGALRVATYNVEELNYGTSGFTALVSILKRVDADVVLLQEVKTSEVALAATLANAAGYAHYQVASVSGTLSGDLRCAVLSRHPIAQAVSWSAAAISGDPQANDICRDILQVEIDAAEACAPVAVFTFHLKSGSTTTDDFRRAVEILRLKEVVESYAASHPSATFFLGGDANEDLADGPFGQTFTSLPGGLPPTYDLGNDVSFPVVYDPFTTISSIGGLGLLAVDATQEDCATCYATRPSSGRRLDYVWKRFSTTLLGDEVYASPVDNGADEAPLGNYLYKWGSPLASNTCSLASDHYPVFTDCLLESCGGTRYGAGYPGDHNLTPRAGITGGISIGDGGFGLRELYGKPNSLTVLVLGQARLSPPYGYPLDPYVPGACLHVSLASMYGLFTLYTDGQGDALLSLPLPPNPAYIGLHLNSQWFVSDTAGPNGVGAMTDAYEVVLQA